MQRPLTPNSCYQLVSILEHGTVRSVHATPSICIKVGVEFASFMQKRTLPCGCQTFVDQPFFNSLSDRIISMMDIRHIHASYSNITLPDGSLGIFSKWSDKSFHDEHIIDVVSMINSECCPSFSRTFFKGINRKLNFRYAFMRWKNASLILRRHNKRLHRFAALRGLSNITEQLLRKMIVTHALLW